MDQIKDEHMKKVLSELAEALLQVYESRLKAVILYGSVARGTQMQDSDIDIMVLVDGNDAKLWGYVKWEKISPFYRNVSEEGVVLYAA